jgi:hypothetical protein
MHGPSRSDVTHHASGALEFNDRDGERWTVSEIARLQFSDRLMSLMPHPERRGGWLLFESDRGERRRLAPIPDNWRTLPAMVLQDHLQSALPAGNDERRRKTD